MRKNDIVDIIWNKVENLNKKDVAEVVDLFLSVVSQKVTEGERIELRKFGTFYRTEKKSRKIYSPIAKKTIDVPARFSIMFKESRYEDENKGD
ncbi:MAG: HU family DNA-binding protein [Spirochaetes bacterium]|nr:HU family DNA-binding protein [Spirochaetota bacterium]